MSSATMPNWMRMIVNINPVSHVVTPVRGLMHGTVTPGQISLVLSSATLVAVFGPLTVYLYHKKSC